MSRGRGGISGGLHRKGGSMRIQGQGIHRAPGPITSFPRSSIPLYLSREQFKAAPLIDL